MLDPSTQGEDTMIRGSVSSPYTAMYAALFVFQPDGVSICVQAFSDANHLALVQCRIIFRVEPFPFNHVVG